MGVPLSVGNGPKAAASRPQSISVREGGGPAAVGFDDLVDFGHQVDRLFQGDDDLLVVGDVFLGKRPAAAVLQSLLADLIAADVEIPDVFGNAFEPAFGVDADFPEARSALECGREAAAFVCGISCPAVDCATRFAARTQSGSFAAALQSGFAAGACPRTS